MGLTLLLKKISLFFLLISASLLSTSFAGRHYRFASNSGKETGATHDHEEVQKPQLSKEEVVEIHERLLKVNAKDYGRYDQAPTLEKPRFKLIPN